MAITIQSTTESQEALDAAASSNWKAPFVAPEQSDQQSSPLPADKPEVTESSRIDKGRGGFTKSIDRLTRQRNEVRDENSRLKQELERYRTPQPTDYNTMDEYKAAVAQPEVRPAPEPVREWAKPEELEQRFNAHSLRMKAAMEQAPDRDEIMQRASQMAIQLHVQIPTLELDNSQDVLIHLARNPELLAELNQMPPTKAQRTIDQLSEALAEQNYTVPEEAKAAYSSAAQAFRAKTPDFESTLANSTESLYQPVADAIIETGDPGIAYILAKNPEKAAKLNELAAAGNEAAMHREIGKLSQQSATQARPRIVPPPPVRKMSGSSAQTGRSLDELSQQDFNRVRNAQERERARR